MNYIKEYLIYVLIGVVIPYDLFNEWQWWAWATALNLAVYLKSTVRKSQPSWPSGSGLENRGFVKGCVGSSPTLSAKYIYGATVAQGTPNPLMWVRILLDVQKQFNVAVVAGDNHRRNAVNVN